MELLKELMGDQDFMKKLYLALVLPDELVFVNREQEVIDLSVWLILDSINAAVGTTSNQVYLLPFLPQMFGAGKTTIALMLLDQAKRHREAIVNTLRSQDFPLPSNLEADIKVLPLEQKAQARMERKALFVAEQVDKFLGATYVRVSLDDLPEPTSKFPTFTDALQAITQQALATYRILPSRELNDKDTANMKTFITAITGGREVVIHFDDVGSLLRSKYNAYFVEGDKSPKWDMKRIYNFWGKIHFLNKMDGVYCFLSGKRSALIFLGLGLLDEDEQQPESPTGAVSVILRMFTPRYIRKIADKLGFWEKLGITDEGLKVRIVAALHQLTGGVPRLVSFSLKVLIQEPNRIRWLFERVPPAVLKQVLRELLYDVFTHEERSNVLKSKEILANPTTMSLYLRLLVLSLRGKGIDKRASIPFMGETVEVPLAVVISALDCYVDKEQEDMWKLVFPELVLMWVSKNCRDQRLTFVADWVLGNPDQVDNGAVNEMVFQLTFETLFASDPLDATRKPLGEVLPFLASSRLAGWRLHMQKDGFTPVPKVTKDVRYKLEDWQRTVLLQVLLKPPADRLGALQTLFDNKDDNEWAKRVSQMIPLGKRKRDGGGIEQADLDKLQSFISTTAHFDASDLIVNHLVPAGHLGCPVSKQSGWPDFYFGEHVEEEEEVKAGKHGGTKLMKQHKQVLLYALWWQIKLYGASTSLTWSTIKEEIAKTPNLAKHSCLVIVSTHLGAEVAQAIGGNTHLLLRTGNGYGIQIPPNFEVVILGEKGLAQLYSEYDLTGLKRLAAANTFEVISKRIQQPTGSLAGVALSHTPVPGRTIKLTFVDSAMKAIVGNGMADVPFGTTLSATKTIIGGVLAERKPDMAGRGITGVEWEGVSVERDSELERVKDRHELVVLLQ